ncbi:MAG TPA: TetR-like C-terminal domain-containing protein, partial [Longimicrobiales bacterium]|nr:TetR-like C-terminal domain-containing protein [Longimicrobiales bacterium]
SRPRDPELETEAGGAFQALVDAVTALQRDGILRDDEPVVTARFVWAVVHGVAMLAIDGQLHEEGAVDELMRFALERIASGLAAPRS